MTPETPETAPGAAPIADEQPLGRNLPKTGLILGVPVLIWSILVGRFAFAVSLTVAAVAVIVHIRWLERLVRAILTGGSPQFSRKDHLKIIGHISLIVAIVVALHVWEQVSSGGLATGVTVAVLAVTVEGFRAANRHSETQPPTS